MTMPAPEPVELPAEPRGWSLDSANAERLQAVTAFGFTDRQARFLLVLLHSGVFVPRQYCQFAGIVHGQKSTDFTKKLVDRQFATPITPGKTAADGCFTCTTSRCGRPSASPTVASASVRRRAA